MFQLFPEELVQPEPLPETVPLTAPVRVAVTGTFGRYATVTRVTGGSTFRLLSDALHSDGELVPSRRAAFLRALDSMSLYYDFLHPLPLSLLAGLASASPPAERSLPGYDEPVRCAILAREGSSAALYLWDGGEKYYRRDAPVSILDIEEEVGYYDRSNAFFAMDQAPSDDIYQKIAPLSLLLMEEPVLPVLSVKNSLADTERLLTALRFNPLTNSRYPEANGTEVIVEDGRSVRIRTNGSVYYQSGGKAELNVECSGEIPTPWEAASGGAALLNAILSPESEAAIYPLEVRQEETRTFLRFGYQIGGIPVRFPDGGSAAVMTLDGSGVSMLELRPRQYTATGETSLLLPLRQALAVMGNGAERELSISYTDTDDKRLEAGWIAG